jgi:hypothetical protein
VVAFVVTP